MDENHKKDKEWCILLIALEDDVANFAWPHRVADLNLKMVMHFQVKRRFMQVDDIIFTSIMRQEEAAVWGNDEAVDLNEDKVGKDEDRTRL